MTVEWPSNLPCPTRAGWHVQRQDRRVRRQNGGPPGYRGRFSLSAKLVNLTIEVSRADKGTFDTFYDDVTQGGVLPFYMPDPSSDGQFLLTSGDLVLLDGEGQPILLAATWLCLFGEQTPVETLIGTQFQIAFGVAVMP